MHQSYHQYPTLVQMKALIESKAEVMACRDGLPLATGKGLMRVILETDSQVSLNLWVDVHSGRLVISAILSDTEGVSKGFEEFSFIAVRRTADAAAHACGQHAMSSDTKNVWLDRVPESFLQLYPRIVTLFDMIKGC